jgi:hypothetical protein
MTREDRLVAAGPSVGPGRWLGVLDELMTRTGSRFSRVEPRRRARAFVLGLLAELPRKNCWAIADFERRVKVAVVGTVCELCTDTSQRAWRECPAMVRDPSGWATAPSRRSS